MDNKSAIRSNMLECRKAITPLSYKRLSNKIQRLFMQSKMYKKTHSIMLYMPVHNEPDTSMIISSALHDNKVVLLPSIKGESVCPVIYKKDMPLKHGKYKIKEPVHAEEYPVQDINVVIVPGVAFDPYGNRIGYGKGYYDKFLGGLSRQTVKAGFSFSRCIVDSVYTNTWDIPVDIIFTETGIKTKEQKV
jgi:5-formyltetrahydrofolate cyclo-ligase